MSQCIQCANLQLREHPKHANTGMGNCKLNPAKHEFVTIERQRDCATYNRADEAVIIKRQSWREQVEKFK